MLRTTVLATISPAEVSRRKPPSGPGRSEVDLDAFPHRRFEPCRVALEVRHDLIAGHEAVGVAAVVGMAGELDEPVRSDQTEAVPAPPPALPHPVPLEHDMVDALVRELMADREPCLAGADNDDLDPIGHPAAILCGVSGAE